MCHVMGRYRAARPATAAAKADQPTTVAPIAMILTECAIHSRRREGHSAPVRRKPSCPMPFRCSYGFVGAYGISNHRVEPEKAADVQRHEVDHSRSTGPLAARLGDVPFVARPRGRPAPADGRSGKA